MRSSTTRWCTTFDRRQKTNVFVLLLVSTVVNTVPPCSQLGLTLLRGPWSPAALPSCTRTRYTVVARHVTEPWQARLLVRASRAPSNRPNDVRAGALQVEVQRALEAAAELDGQRLQQVIVVAVELSRLLQPSTAFELVQHLRQVEVVDAFCMPGGTLDPFDADAVRGCVCLTTCM
jgi:hypothetical protein